MNDTPFPAFVPHAVTHHRGWLAVLGVALLILGVLCLIFTVAATLLTTIAIGVLMLLGGIGLLISAFWTHRVGHAVARALIGLAFIAAGLWLISRPVLGAVALTAIIGWFFIFSGAVRLIEAVVAQRRGWGWSILNGGITLLLGILLLAHWPLSGLVAIGIFLGIDLLFDGGVILMSALAGRTEPRQFQAPPPQRMPPLPAQ